MFTICGRVILELNHPKTGNSLTNIETNGHISMHNLHCWLVLSIIWQCQRDLLIGNLLCNISPIISHPGALEPCVQVDTLTAFQVYASLLKNPQMPLVWPGASDSADSADSADSVDSVLVVKWPSHHQSPSVTLPPMVS